MNRGRVAVAVAQSSDEDETLKGSLRQRLFTPQVVWRGPNYKEAKNKGFSCGLGVFIVGPTP